MGPLGERLVGVDGVVDDGPGDATGVERQADGPGAGAEGGRGAEEGAPVEGEAEEELGPVGEALHERVGHHQRQRRGAQHDAAARACAARVRGAVRAARRGGGGGPMEPDEGSGLRHG